MGSVNEQPCLAFYAGTLEIRQVARESTWVPKECIWDERTGCFRAKAMHYAQVVMTLIKNRIPYTDEARRYETLTLRWENRPPSRTYQQEAISSWIQAQGQGVVVLPTGAGKTHVALLALLQKPRSTLVLAPTLELVRQWHGLLQQAFRCNVGMIGGGTYDICPITVSTYDSAYLHMDHLGNRFGLVVFDECHHLPSESYSLAAQLCLAPYRLGLTATPERSDGQEERLTQLIGPVVYRKEIQSLSGHYLAAYETRRITVALTEEERQRYQAARAVYRQFLMTNGIRIGEPGGWTQFIILASRSKEGQRAMDAYQAQRKIAMATPAKLDHVERLIAKHARDRVLLFTNDNATVYDVSKRFLIPAITHQTKQKERCDILAGFKTGVYTSIVTSKVLNEGVDVPEANIAIVMSGSGSVREHVQRLGRILRPQQGKQAVLYELVSEDTLETYTSKRRRDHQAYQ